MTVIISLTVFNKDNVIKQGNKSTKTKGLLSFREWDKKNPLKLTGKQEGERRNG